LLGDEMARISLHRPASSVYRVDGIGNVAKVVRARINTILIHIYNAANVSTDASAVEVSDH
jgi:hypothetical protein